MKLLTALLILSLSISVAAKPMFGDVTVSEITKVIDGDSFKVNIEGWPDIIGKNMSIRVNGIDTPGLRGMCEDEKLLAGLARAHTIVMLRNAKTIELRRMQKGKFFRIVADVYLDGVSLGDELIQDGLAREYHGKKKTDWCGGETAKK